MEEVTNPENSGEKSTTDDELSEEEKAAAEAAEKAKQAVADAKSKAEEAKTKAEGAQIKQDAADAQELLDGAKAELAKASDSTEGYGDAQAAIEAAETAVGNIPGDLPEQLPEPEPNEIIQSDAEAVNEESAFVSQVNLNGQQDAEINAAEPTEGITAVDVQVEQWDVTSADSADHTSGADAVSVEWQDGVIDGEVTKAPIKFTLTAKDGWTLGGIDVTATAEKTEGGPENLTVTGGGSSDGKTSAEYTVVKNTTVKVNDTTNVDYYTGDVKIVIKAKHIKKTLKTASSNVYLLGGSSLTSDDISNNGIDNSTGKSFIWEADKDVDVRVAVKVTDGNVNPKYENITVKSEEAVNASGSGNNILADSALAQVGENYYCIYTIKPSALDGFNKNKDEDITITAETAKDAKTLTLAVDTESGEKKEWTAKKPTLTGGTVGTGLEYKAIWPSSDDFYHSFTPTDVQSLLDENNYEKYHPGKDDEQTRAIAFGLHGNNVSDVADERTVWSETKLGTPEKLYAVTRVYAELSKTGDADSVLKTFEEEIQTSDNGTPDNEKDDFYYIPLNVIEKSYFEGLSDSETGLTLTVKAETTLPSKEVNTNIYEAKFEGNTGNLASLKLTAENGTNLGTAKAIENNEYKGFIKRGDTSPYATAGFEVKAKDDYHIIKGTDYSDGGNYDKSVVLASYTKVYASSGTGSSSVFAGEQVEVENEELSLTSDVFTFTFRGKDKAYEEGATETKEYIATNVVFTIKTELDETDGGKITVTSDDLEYTLTGDGVEPGTVRDEYTISDTAKALTLTVASADKPVATYFKTGDATTETGAVSFTGGEGSYTAEIPVAQLRVVSSEVDSHITITRGTKTFTLLQKEGTNAAVKYSGNVYLNESETAATLDGNGVLTNTGIAAAPTLMSGDKAVVKIKAPTGYALTGVEIQKTETKNDVTTNKGEPEKIDLGDGAADASFSLEMTDDFKVTASIKKIYTAVVKYDTSTDAPYEEESDEYVIPEGKGNIVIALKNGTDSVDLRYAKVYDDGSPAATKATIEGTAGSQTAKITSIDAKDTGVLRVDLVPKGSGDVALSVNIRRVQNAKKLVIRDAEGNEVSELSQLADSGETKLTVEAADGGNVQNAISNIGVEVLNADGKTYKNIAGGLTNATKIADTKDIKVTVENDGETVKLNVDFIAALQGKEKAVVFRLYDIAKRAAAKSDKNATDKECLMTGDMTINVLEPSIIGKKPTVEIVNSDPENIRLKITSESGIAHPAIIGDNGDGTAARGNVVLYKVDVDGPVSKGISKTQYFKKHNYGSYGETDYYTFQVLDPEVEKPENIKANDYTVKVEIVQTTKAALGAGSEDAAAATAAVNDERAKVLIHSGVVETLTTRTPDPTLETKLKLTPASVKVSSNQDYTDVSRAEFGSNAGWRTIRNLRFVDTKTNATRGTESLSSGNWTASWTADGGRSISAQCDEYNKIYIKSVNMPTTVKNLGLEVMAEGGATAILKINVEQGYSGIRFVSGNNRSLYKQPDKTASMTLKAVFYENGVETKPKNKALYYHIVSSEDDLADAKAKGIPASVELPSSEIFSGVELNGKSGKITVEKDFNINKDVKKNQFVVKAYPAGNYNTDERAYVLVTITGEAQTLGGAVIVKKTGVNYEIVARDGGILKAEDFFNNETNQLNELYVKTLKTSTGSKRVYKEEDFADDGVTYASKAKKSLAVSTVDGKLTFYKAQAKPVKLTITPADGSKNKTENREISVTLQGYSQVGLWIDGAAGTALHARQKDDPSVTSLTYDGVMNAMFTVSAGQKVNGEWKKSNETQYDYSNMTVKAKGAKLIAKKAGKAVTGYDLIMTSPSATVTVTDKTTKQTMTYTINQVPPMLFKKADATVKTDKLTAADVAKAYAFANSEPGSEQVKMNFQITTKKDVTPVNYARKYVLIAPDFTKTKNVYGTKPEWKKACDYFMGGTNRQLIQIDDNGRFSLNFSLDSREYLNVPGTYSLIVTMGEYSDGKFSPLTKSVTVKIKVPTKKVKSGLTLKGDYVLDAASMRPVSLNYNNNIKTGCEWDAVNETYMGSGNYAWNKVDPKTGIPNDFNTYFCVEQVAGEWVLKLNDGLTKDQISYITDPVAGGVDREGYVTIAEKMSGVEQLRKDLKIKVSFQNVQSLTAKLADEAESVYVGEEATLQIFGSASAKTALDLAGAAVMDGADLSKDSVAKTGLVDANSIKIKLKDTTAGTKTVTLKVLTADSPYANLESKEAKAYNGDFKKLAQEFGTEITAQIVVSEKGNATVNKAVIEIEDSQITAKDYKESSGKYSKECKVKSKIQGAAVASVEVARSVDGAAFEGASIFAASFAGPDKINLTVKRDKLIAANAAGAGSIKFGSTVDVPVTVKFDKQVASEVCMITVTMPSPMTYEDALKAVEPMKADISQMTADEVFETEANAMMGLEKRINDTIDSYIPRDAQLMRLGMTTAGGPYVGGTYQGYQLKAIAEKAATAETAVDPRHYELEIRFKKDNTVKDADAQKLTFRFEEYAGGASVSEIQSKINALTAADKYANLSNDYTEEKLLEDLTSALQKPVIDGGTGKRIPSHITLSVKANTFKLKKVKVGTPGSLTATIVIEDKGKNISEEASVNVATIPAFNNLAQAKTAIGTALASTTTFDPAKVLAEAMKDDSATMETYAAALETALTAAINKAINNPNITFTFTPTTPKSGSTYVTLGGSEDDERNVDFKLATSTMDGWIAFKGELSQPNMKNLAIDHYTVAITMAHSGNETLYQALGTKTTAGSAAKAVADELAKAHPVKDKTLSVLKSHIEFNLNKSDSGLGPCYTVEFVEFKDKKGEDGVVLGDTDTLKAGKVYARVTITDKLARNADPESNSITLTDLDCTVN